MNVLKFQRPNGLDGDKKQKARLSQAFSFTIGEPSMTNMQGYQCLLNSLYDDKKLDSISRDIIIFLNCFPSEVFPSEKLISKKIGKSQRTIIRHLKILESLEYLLIDSRSGPNGSNRYYLNYEKIRPAHSMGHKVRTGASMHQF